ncbi:hypothetical protein GCM10027299_42900 [Larkinella ripae]
MKNYQIRHRFKALVYTLFLGVWITGCQDKAGADFIYEASSQGVAVGAYGGFRDAFPDAQAVSWSNVQERIWEARFSQNAMEKAAFFHSNGVMIDQGTRVPQTVLPENARNYLNATYPGGRVQTVLTGPNGSDNSPFRVFQVNATGSRIWRVLLTADGQLQGATEL